MPDLSISAERGEQSCPDLSPLAPAVLWNDIGPGEHFVQFYDHDSSLIESLTSYLAEGFRDGQAALVVATEPRRREVEDNLASEGFDIGVLKESRRYVPLDARETLSALLESGTPSESEFERHITPIVRELCAAGNGVRAFGEMVALLCAEGNVDAAIALEELWNQVRGKHQFALFCAYPINVFQGEAHRDPFAKICKAHSRVIPAESYSRKGRTAEERLREITSLQQKAAALEAEVASRKRFQEELARREEELRDFLENAAIGIHQVNADGKILWANHAELELLGYEPHEYIGRQITDFHADSDVICDMLARLKRGEKLHDHEARLKHKDGSIRYVNVNSSGRWNGGEFLYTRCFTRDITERKHAAELLEKTVAERTAQLQEIVGELEAFSYSISHDMRSPLRAMQAYASSVMEDYRDKPLDQEGQLLLGRIQRAATRMDSLIRDVLAYTKITKGEIILKPVPLAPLVEDIIDQQFYRQKNSIAAGRLETVLGHEAYLCQCITNLLDNAFKFMANGTAPRVRIETQRIDADWIRVLVSDNGIGIHPDHRNRIFKIFGRVYSEKQYAGTGIGLAIVEKAVIKMGGLIGFDSEPGQGSTFWFNLRAPAAS